MLITLLRFVGHSDKIPMKNSLLWALAVLLSGCSTFTPSSLWDPHKNAATKASHKEVIEELNSQKERRPASIMSELNLNFGDLRRLSPAKFEVYVFPKISSQTMREEMALEEYLGPPRLFEVSIIAVGPCKQFIVEGHFSKYKPNEAFPVNLADADRQCGIMEISDRKLATVDKALLKQDDQLVVRLFIDDSYKVHATDHVIFETRNQNRVVRRVSEEEGIASGLSYFPMDLPASNARATKAELGKQFSKKLDGVSVHQIQKKYARSFSAPHCDGVVFSSKDPLGGASTVGWCQGTPWPTYLENSRFFSVTQPLRVR